MESKIQNPKSKICSGPGIDAGAQPSGSDNYDVVIIGAGMSGLAAGIRLAHYQKRVCILERHTTIGGLNSFYRQGGRNFDVGLHALTNYAPKGDRRGPLGKLLRQLRFTWDEFALVPQVGSSIRFPGVRLDFDNDFQRLADEIAAQFPTEKDALGRLVGELVDYEHVGRAAGETSAREVVGRLIRDPLLVEMLFCPLLYYGGSRERDMDFELFSVLFRSVYMEGLARPLAGVRLILKNLVRKFKALGGQLRLRAGVQRIVVREGRAEKVILDDGTELAARYILSSAGWPETMRLCDDPQQVEVLPGQLSFAETISILNVQPRTLGHDRTMVFFNDSEQFDYARPNEPVDLRSGVICSPNNFLYDEPPSEGVVRVTVLANFDRWASLEPGAYQLAKLGWYDKIVAAAVRFVPDFRFAVIETDMFTPTTIRRFTGHDNGAVYGVPRKRRDGTTHLSNLYVCGTDQGMVGIIGSILSGITIANRYLLVN
jgi:phytoene dehydrogenase-like protein